MATIRRLDDTQAEFAEGTLVGVQATATPSLALAYRPMLSFDGVDDSVTIASDGYGIFNTPSYTIECMVNVSNLTNYVVLWSYDYTSHIPPYYAQHLRVNSDGSVFFGFNIAGTYTKLATPTGIIAAGQWYHIASTFTDSSQKIYVDGVEQATGANTGSITYYNQEVWLGRANYGYTKACTISDIRFWNVARTQAEIQANMNKRLLGTEPGLVAYYKLDEGSGTIATDSAGTNDGIIYGSTWTTDPSFYMSSYMSSGYRVTPNLDLSQENIILNSNIKWTATLNNQTIVIEARTSTDGGVTWSAWQTCTNNAPIPGIQPNSLLQIRQSLATTDMSTTPELTSLDIVIETAAGSISGTVTEEGANVQRTIRAYLRSDGHLVDEVISNTDGTFTLYTETLDEHYVIALDDTGDATDYNALIFDRITPGSV